MLLRSRRLGLCQHGGFSTQRIELELDQTALVHTLVQRGMGALVGVNGLGLLAQYEGRLEKVDSSLSEV